MSQWRMSALLVFVAAEAALVGQLALRFTQLPPRVATHFGRDGLPNAFGTPETLALHTVGLASLFAALFAGAGFVDRIPLRFLNVPNRDYWFAGERRAASFAFLIQWLRWLVALLAVLFVFVMGAVLEANLATPVRLGASADYVLVASVVGVLVMIVLLVRRFPRPPAQ
jgi:hypothetical protein